MASPAPLQLNRDGLVDTGSSHRVIEIGAADVHVHEPTGTHGRFALASGWLGIVIWGIDRELEMSMQVRLGECVIDTDSRQVRRGGLEARLSPKAYQLLVLLVDARPKALPKERLYQHLWPGTFVVEANLPNLISEIRAALGDCARRPRIIRTLHGFGYACAADVDVTQAEEIVSVAEAPLCWLSWSGRELWLASGENIVGRGVDVQIRIDAPGISRRHARILVDGQDAAIEDLGSRNGTFVQGERLSSTRRLVSGYEVCFGSTRTIFHTSTGDGSTETIRVADISGVR